MNNSASNFKQELNRCVDIAKSEVDRLCSSFTNKCNVIKTVSYGMHVVDSYLLALDTMCSNFLFK